MGSKLLDFERAEDIANELVSILTDQGGYTAEEAIPGLLKAIEKFSMGSPSRMRLLDESSDYLMDIMDAIDPMGDDYNE